MNNTYNANCSKIFLKNVLVYYLLEMNINLDW